jgi:hypothetical protein
MTTQQTTRQNDINGGMVEYRKVVVQRGDFVARDKIIEKANIEHADHVTYMIMPRSVDKTKAKRPYFAGRPFRIDDADLFTGRIKEKTQILGMIHDPESIAAVVYGPADVGKTSLLSAGVLAELNDRGTNLIPLRDYVEATSHLKKRLLGHIIGMNLEISENASVSELTKTINDASPRRMIWFLDQFERFFLQEVSDRERQALSKALRETIDVIDSQDFQILLAIRDNWTSDLIQMWGHLLPGLEECMVFVPPFSREQAKYAILHPPIELNIKPEFDEDFVADQLLDDLDRLSQDQPEKILPADMQIVCNHLYEHRYSKRPQIIKTEQYDEATDGKGAEWILDQHFNGLLTRIKGAQRTLVEDISREMLAKGSQTWVMPTQLHMGRVTTAELATTLDEMYRAELVVWHLYNQEKSYAFASNSIAKAAERALGQEVRKQIQAHRELEYVWRDWLENKEWAKQYQLNLLQDYYGERIIPAEQALLMLRSAVNCKMDIQPWLDRLNNATANQLIQELEEAENAQITDAKFLTRHRQQAGDILGIFDGDQPQKPPSNKFGLITWTAAIHKEWQCRESDVLATMSFYKSEALERVEQAVAKAKSNANLSNRQSPRRLAELRGILADAESEIAEKICREKSRRERFDTWWWRFKRRVGRDWRYILGITMGGAIGAGLALGLLRFLMAPMLGQDSGFLLYSYFPTGFLLGGALSLGLLLVNPIGLKPFEQKRTGAGTQPTEPFESQSGGTTKRSLVLAVVYGSIFFAGMHVLLILLLRPAGLIESPLIPILALLAGAGLSYTLHDQPMAGWHIGLGRWILRLAVVALTFIFVQGIFVLVDVMLGPDEDLGTGLIFAWSGYTFKSALYSVLKNRGLENILSIDHWFHYPALADSALTGIVLAMGLNIGLISAGNWYWKWKSLVRKVSE